MVTELGIRAARPVGLVPGADDGAGADAEFANVIVRGVVIAGAGSSVLGDFIAAGTIVGSTVQTSESGAMAIMASGGGYAHGFVVQNASNQLLSMMRESRLTLAVAGVVKAYLAAETSPPVLYYSDSGRVYAVNDLTLETGGGAGANVVIDGYQITLGGATPITGTKVTIDGELGFDIAEVSGKTGQDEYVPVKRRDGTQRYLRFYA